MSQPMPEWVKVISEEIASLKAVYEKENTTEKENVVQSGLMDIAQIRKRLSALEASRHEMLQDLTARIERKLQCLDSFTGRVDLLAQRVRSAEDKIASPKKDEAERIDKDVSDLRKLVNQIDAKVSDAKSSLVFLFNCINQLTKQIKPKTKAKPNPKIKPKVKRRKP